MIFIRHYQDSNSQPVRSQACAARVRVRNKFAIYLRKNVATNLHFVHLSTNPHRIDAERGRKFVGSYNESLNVVIHCRHQSFETVAQLGEVHQTRFQVGERVSELLPLLFHVVHLEENLFDDDMIEADPIDNRFPLLEEILVVSEVLIQLLLQQLNRKDNNYPRLSISTTRCTSTKTKFKNDFKF